MCLIVSGVSTLIHLYSISYMTSDRGFNRFFAYLNFFVFSMLLLVLAGNLVLLIVGWAFVGFASYALISFWYRRDHRHPRRDEGLRHQRRRRRRHGARRLLHLPGPRHLRPALDLQQGARHLPHQPGRRRRDLLPAAGRRLRQVGPGPAPHLAAGCDGGPHPGLGPDPRGDDGHRRRLPDRPLPPALRDRPDRGRHRRLRRARHAADRGDDRSRRHRPEADHRLLDHEPDRLHGRSGSGSGPTRRASST